MDGSGQVVGGRYRLLRPLGSGGMAEVWLAADQRLGDKHVAVKKLLGFAPGGPAQASDIERARREALAASRLNHPNLVSVTDFVADEGEPFIVMEFVDGTTLDDVIADRGVDPARGARLIGEVAAALAEAHEAGIVHRDIKPANIMVTRRDVAKLADFGIARTAGDARLTRTGFFTGTAAYLAPELLDGSDASSASDVWALGAVLYEAVEGRRAFAGDSTPAILAAITVKDLPHSTRSPELGRLIDRMLTRDPGERMPIREVAQSLAAIGSGGTTGPVTQRDQETVGLAAAPTAPTTPGGPPGPRPVGAGGPPTGPPIGPPTGPPFGPSWSGPHPVGPPPKPRRGRGRWIAATAAVIVVAAGTIAVIALQSDGSNTAGQGGNSSKSEGVRTDSGTKTAGSPTASSDSSSDSSSTASGPLRVLAHRGGRESYAEQTIPAFVAAAQKGYGIETDVRWSSDDVAVIVHDPTTENNLECAGGPYTVSKITAAQLQSKCHTPAGASPDGKTYPPPTFEQAAKALSGIPGATLFAEVKVHQTSKQVNGFLSILNRNGLIDRAVVTSFYADELDKMRSGAKPFGTTLRLMLFLGSGKTLPPAQIAKSATWVAVELKKASKKYFRSLKNAGLTTVGYLANTDDQWSALRSAGADYVLTDVPSAYLTWLGSR